MDGDIQAHEFNEGFVIAKAKQCGQIVGVIFGRVDGGELSLTKDIAINSPRNTRELGDPRRSVSAGRGGEEQIKRLTDPWSLQKQAPSSPFWKCPESMLWQTQNRGSTAIKVIREQ